MRAPGYGAGGAGQPRWPIAAGGCVPASNEIYDEPGDIWWADDQPMSIGKLSCDDQLLQIATG